MKSDGARSLGAPTRFSSVQQIILEKQTFFSRVPHSGGTSVSSAGFFLEKFGKITLEHRVSISISPSQT